MSLNHRIVIHSSATRENDNAEFALCIEADLSFNQAMKSVQDYDWSFNVKKLKSGQECNAFSLSKADDADNYMQFFIFAVDDDLFSIQLNIMNKRNRRYIWERTSVSVDLGVCTKSELQKKLEPLRSYSVSRLYNKHRSKTWLNKHSLLVVILLLVVLGIMIERWIQPLHSPSFDALLWNPVLYIGASVFSTCFLVLKRVRQGLRGGTWKDRASICLGMICLGPLIVFSFMLSFGTYWHMLTKKPASQVEVVAELPSTWSSTGRGSCTGKLWVHPSGEPQHERILCYVPKELWAELKVGDRLLLNGERSSVAFTPADILTLPN